MPAIPFAGLAPDGRVIRGGGALSSFGFGEAVQIGRDLRRASGDVATGADLASAMLDGLNALEHDGRSAWVLLQVFANGKAGGSERAEADDQDPDLLASRGIEPGWNDVVGMKSHRVLPGGATVVVSQLVRQLRDPSPPPASTFYVPEASTSASISDKSFVTAYGVRSVIGFGVSPWTGQSVVFIGFARDVVERGALRMFETLGLYAKLAWIESGTARHALGADRGGARARVLDELTASHETNLIDTAFEWRRVAEATRSDAQRHADLNADRLERQNQEMRRAQRAMLNVVEDLREARATLASKVAERTRELADANLELQARNRDLEEFAYIASHDLQEPLRTVAGYLQMVERRFGDKLGPEGDEFLRFAIEGAQRMQALIESLLTYSRVTSKQHALERVPLDEVVDVALRNLALRFDETHATIDRARLPTVQADRIQMIQLFQNLLANALKFAGGRPPRIHLTGTVSEGSCVVTVRDEGIGFDQKFAERIFKIFRRLRRDTPGTGIGLAVCKKIVERHGGSIAAHSSPGAGASFVVRLPVETSPGAET